MSKPIELNEHREIDTSLNYLNYEENKLDETLLNNERYPSHEELANAQGETPNRIIKKKPYLKRSITPNEETICDKCEKKYSSVAFHHHHKRCLGSREFKERRDYAKLMKRIKEMRKKLKHDSSQKSIKRPFIGNECPNCKKKLSKHVYLSHVKLCGNTQSPVFKLKMMKEKRQRSIKEDDEAGCKHAQRKIEIK